MDCMCKADPAEALGPVYTTQQTVSQWVSDPIPAFQARANLRISKLLHVVFFPIRTPRLFVFLQFFWTLKTSRDHLLLTTMAGMVTTFPGLHARLLVTAGARVKQADWGERAAERWCVCRGLWGTILLQADWEPMAREEFAVCSSACHPIISLQLENIPQTQRWWRMERSGRKITRDAILVYTLSCETQNIFISGDFPLHAFARIQQNDNYESDKYLKEQNKRQWSDWYSTRDIKRGQAYHTLSPSVQTSISIHKAQVWKLCCSEQRN